MTTKTFQMTWDQVDAIVIDELKDAHDRNLDLDRDEGGVLMDPDWDLIESIETVLAYFMPKDEYETWRREAGLRKMTVTSELMGGYDDECEPEPAG